MAILRERATEREASKLEYSILGTSVGIHALMKGLVALLYAP
jgi:hypothetical protein